MQTDAIVSGLAPGASTTVVFGPFLPGSLGREFLLINTTANAFLLTVQLGMFFTVDEARDGGGGRRLWNARQIALAASGNITVPAWERINRFRWLGLTITNNDGANSFSGTLFSAVQPPYNERDDK